MIPRGYGVAWRNHDVRTNTLAIIPFNFLFAWVRTCYFRLMAGPRDGLRQQIIAELSEDEARGFNLGYQDGFKTGEKAALRQGKILVAAVVEEARKLPLN